MSIKTKSSLPYLAVTTAGANPALPRSSPASKVACPSIPVRAVPSTRLLRAINVISTPSIGLAEASERANTRKCSAPLNVVRPMSEIKNHWVARTSYWSGPAFAGLAVKKYMPGFVCGSASSTGMLVMTSLFNSGAISIEPFHTASPISSTRFST